MNPEKPAWIDVQALMPQVSVQQIAAYYRFALSESFGTSGEQRMRCPVASCDGHSDDRSVSVDVGNPKGLWKCHRKSYGCGAQGDKLTLMYCMKHGQMPPGGGQPKGKQFREIAEDLATIAGGGTPPTPPEKPDRPAATEQTPDRPLPIDQQPNTPLAESTNEAARNLVTLDEQFVVEPSEMNPAASRYMRDRPWLTPAFCREARCGYLPSNAKSTLRGQWVFGVFDDDGQPLCWVGRDVRFDEKWQAYVEGGQQGDEPAKYRFPSTKLFRRKFELFGQEQIASGQHAETVQRSGLIVVEGFNDVLRLRTLGVPAVGIMSNHVTDEQLEKLVRMAEEHAGGRIAIMFDANAQGDDGAKDALWKIAQTGSDVKLVWSRSMFDGRFDGREPESLTDDEWKDVAIRLQ